jgi:hypothetical protein
MLSAEQDRRAREAQWAASTADELQNKLTRAEAQAEARKHEALAAEGDLHELKKRAAARPDPLAYVESFSYRGFHWSFGCFRL